MGLGEMHLAPIKRSLDVSWSFGLHFPLISLPALSAAPIFSM